ncbi:MAG: outer membrane beta-barrel protein [Chitinophagales bacterium]|nr:outer membrane beta-barrel protein [Chitinophagales bacterium]
MRQVILISAISILSLSLRAQEPSTFRKVNFEFMAGYLNSPVVGVGARSLREGIDATEDIFPSYSGAVLPKSSAYVGILVDYRFHPLVGIGSGMVYTPKGWWIFEQNDITDVRIKTFYTVDYFELPLFLQIYARPKLSFRAGPVISFAGITKTRIVTKDNGDRDVEQYRFGENGTRLAREIVPGIEAALTFGNLSGLHGTFGVQYSGSFYEGYDIRPIAFKLGIGYTISR